MTLLFQKPELEIKKVEAYLASLDKQIVDKERDLEQLMVSYQETSKSLEVGFQKEVTEKKQAIDALEMTLISKREERAQLESSLEDRRLLLDAKEITLIEREKKIEIKEQALFEKDKECEAKLDSVKELANNLGEIGSKQRIKEQVLDTREKVLQDKENQILLETEALSEKRNLIHAELLTREEAVTFKEISVEGKEENISKREEQLIKDKILLNSQRASLESAIKEKSL